MLKNVVRLLTMNVWLSIAPPPHDITPYHLVSMSTFYTTLGEGRYHIGIIFSGFMDAFESSNCSIIQTNSLFLSRKNRGFGILRKIWPFSFLKHPSSNHLCLFHWCLIKLCKYFSSIIISIGKLKAEFLIS